MPCPTVVGSCAIVLAVVIKAILCEMSLFAAANADAERLRASPIPPDDIAKLLPQTTNQGDVCSFIICVWMASSISSLYSSVSSVQ